MAVKYGIIVYLLGAPSYGFEVNPAYPDLNIYDQFREDRIDYQSYGDNRLMVVYFKTGLITHRNGRHGSNFGIAVEVQCSAIGSDMAHAFVEDNVVNAISNILYDEYCTILQEGKLLVDSFSNTAFAVDSFESAPRLVENTRTRVANKVAKIMDKCSGELAKIALEYEAEKKTTMPKPQRLPPKSDLPPVIDNVQEEKFPDNTLAETDSRNDIPAANNMQLYQHQYTHHTAQKYGIENRLNWYLLMFSCFLLGAVVVAAYYRFSQNAASTPFRTDGGHSSDTSLNGDAIVVALNQLCKKAEVDSLSLDSITTDSIVAKIEAVEKKVLTKTGGSGKADTDTKTKADTDTKTKADTDTKPETDTKTKTKPETKPETDTDTKTKPETETKPETKPETETETETETSGS